MALFPPDILRDQKTGNPIAGAAVFVTASLTGLPAALTDNSGNALTNPLFTDSYGSYSFNAPDGSYNLEYRYGGRVIGELLNQYIGAVAQLPAGSVTNALGTSTTIAPSQAAVQTGLDGKANNGDLAGKTNKTDLAASAGSALVGFKIGSTSATPRTVQAKLAELPSALDFGAVGDNATDNVVSLQAGIDFIAGLGGGTLFLPTGRYLISAPLIMRNSVQIVGSGNNLGAGQDSNFQGSIIRPTKDMPAMFAQTSYATPLAKLGLKDIYVDGRSYDGIAVSSLIDLTCHNSVFDDLNVQNATGSGFTVRANSQYAWINRITNSFIGGCGVYGLAFSGTDTFITGNYFSACMAANALLDCSGAVTFSGNRLELAGNGTNSNSFGLILQNTMTAAAVPFNYSVVTNNVFLENAHDTSWTDSAVSGTTSAGIYSNNLHHATAGTSCLVGLRVCNGIAIGNHYSDVTGPCFQMTSGGSQSGWNIGPFSYSGSNAGATNRIVGVATPANTIYGAT